MQVGGPLTNLCSLLLKLCFRLHRWHHASALPRFPTIQRSSSAGVVTGSEALTVRGNKRLQDGYSVEGMREDESSRLWTIRTVRRREMATRNCLCPDNIRNELASASEECLKRGIAAAASRLRQH